jgi:hypothetical protein
MFRLISGEKITNNIFGKCGFAILRRVVFFSLGTG